MDLLGPETKMRPDSKQLLRTGLISGALDCVEEEEVTEEAPRSERSQPEEPDTSNKIRFL